ncbi:Agmatine coumaroyltransferase-2 [Linum perenne]
MPLKLSPSVMGLHLGLKGVDELVQVQLTRFACGGFTSHHLVADGHSTSKFLVAWGMATRGLDMCPLPIHDRTIFTPRKPPSFDTFVSLVAHLWRAMTIARSLNMFKLTNMQISVNGRTRMIPRVPDEYFGNLVLWAFPTCRVGDLLDKPLPYIAELINDAIKKVNNDYFRSFVDFANHKVKEGKLVPTADNDKSVLCPNLAVDSWLKFPFYDLDFGTGCPYVFIPSYLPIEGLLFLLPSFIGDGSIDAFVPLFKDNLDILSKFADYREWAGRLGEDGSGNSVILLNDEGVKFVEAMSSSRLDQVMPMRPSPSVLSLHPGLKGVEELVQVQLTRFACGSLVVGFTAHHLVVDGHSTSNFLVAWGMVTPGLDVGPLPLHDRTIFAPWKPPSFEYNQEGVEYKQKNHSPNGEGRWGDNSTVVDDIIVHKVHFTLDFLTKLKSRSCNPINNKPYSTFVSLVAHLWTAVTKLET